MGPGGFEPKRSAGQPCDAEEGAADGPPETKCLLVPGRSSLTLGHSASLLLPLAKASTKYMVRDSGAQGGKGDLEKLAFLTSLIHVAAGADYCHRLPYAAGNGRS